ncbi:helix-turn-helix domain-containing protein [Leptospira sp. 201903071]|uniref:helix-turn-helix domain-containing protein n=1 Tax=Leptospira ainazelensis TaxID=2810034 RepID=UPI0019632165|nr:helix-turn-helix domain-containing protein [Leptospira ainazelensis]MBM9499696.1 helix-turn-helix domain-containing protein [Leptospira ainazelensis]
MEEFDYGHADHIPGVIKKLKLSRGLRDLLSKITHLDIGGRRLGKGGCFATNKSLGEECGFAEETVAKYVRRLRQLGFVEAGAFHGHYRILRSTLHDAVIQETQFRRKPNAQGNDPGQGRVEQQGSPGQSRSHAPDNRSSSCTLLTKERIKKLTYQGAPFDENSNEWKKFLGWSKEKLSKSTLNILTEVKINFDGTNLNVLTQIPESIEKVVEKYFFEDHPKKFIVKFSEKKDARGMKEDVIKTENKSSPPFIEKKESNLMTEEDIRKAMLELQRIREGETGALRRRRIAA